MVFLQDAADRVEDEKQAASGKTHIGKSAVNRDKYQKLSKNAISFPLVFLTGKFPGNYQTLPAIIGNSNKISITYASISTIGIATIERLPTTDARRWVHRVSVYSVLLLLGGK
jgi:hypothetical protein